MAESPQTQRRRGSAPLGKVAAPVYFHD